MALFASGRDAHAATTTVTVGDFYFCSSSFEDGVCDTTINAGDTVTWDYSGAFNSHTSTACGSDCDNPSTSPLWDSGTINGGTYSFTFDTVGTYLYFCTIHPTQMRGRIIVQGGAEPTATTGSINGTPVATSTPGGSGLPTTGQGPTKEDSSPIWPLVLLAVGGGALGLAGAAVYMRTRR
jgi:hypothetical protein